MSNRNRSLPQPAPRICIFCENTAASPEHIWSDWMGKHFPKKPHAESITRWDNIDERDAPLPQPIITHGHPVNTTVKAVCKKCNNGWMSILEQQAKPYIESMLLGKPTVLDLKGQCLVIEWTTLKMMVWEHSQAPESIVFTRMETLQFSSTRKIPENIKTWLFRSSDPIMRASIIRGYSALTPVNNGTLNEPPDHANTQTALFRIGKLLIYFFHSTLPELEIGKFRQFDAKVLWPTARTLIKWPPMRDVGIPEARHIAESLKRFLARPDIVPFERRPVIGHINT